MLWSLWCRSVTLLFSLYNKLLHRQCKHCMCCVCALCKYSDSDSTSLHYSLTFSSSVYLCLKKKKLLSGSYMKAECDGTKQTECAKCGRELYTATKNHLTKCHVCKSCSSSKSNSFARMHTLISVLQTQTQFLFLPNIFIHIVHWFIHANITTALL